MKKLDDMLFEWHKLRHYYSNKNYSGNESEKDLEISIFMIKNYLYWLDFCQTYKSFYARNGQVEIAEALGEALNTLEYAMEEIIKTVRDYDEFGF